MKNTRCEEVVVQLVVRTYDDMGRPIREQMSQPTKVFRNAETLDFWAQVDKAVKLMQDVPPPDPTAKPKGKKR